MNWLNECVQPVILIYSSTKHTANMPFPGLEPFLGEVPILLGIPYEVTIHTLIQSHLFRIIITIHHSRNYQPPHQSSIYVYYVVMGP